MSQTFPNHRYSSEDDYLAEVIRIQMLARGINERIDAKITIFQDGRPVSQRISKYDPAKEKKPQSDTVVTRPARKAAQDDNIEKIVISLPYQSYAKQI